MTKSEMRKALQDGMKVYIESGKSITKCEVPQENARARKPRMHKEEVEIETQNLPMALQIRFGFQKK